MNLPFWRSFRTAAWLGWQIESNWADPFLFAVYSIVKPISGAAILVVMYSIITNGAFDSPIFTYMYLGNAFYIYVDCLIPVFLGSIVDSAGNYYSCIIYKYVKPAEFIHCFFYYIFRISRHRDIPPDINPLGIFSDHS